MADEYLHGVRVIESNDGTRTVKSIATAVIGVVCTADDADANYFPLNTPVLINNPTQAKQYAGKTGTLKRTLNAIGSMVKTPTVIVRVADSDDEETLTANLIGTITNEGKYTGMKALLVAQSIVGVKPRIFAIPKHDTQLVATELLSIAKQLNGFAYISAHDATTKEEANAYRRNFANREGMLIFGNWYSANEDTGKAEIDYAVARAVGLRAYIDKEIGWHKNLSNVELSGITGVTHPLSFDINDSATDTNFLNENSVTTCLNYNGFKFWGGRTLSTDTAWSFEQATRTAQIIKDTFAEAFDWAIDKPLTPLLAKEIVAMINNKFRFWKNAGYIIDGNAWVDAELSTGDVIKDGKLYIKYDYHWMPSLENLNLTQVVNDEYVMNFASEIAAA